MRRQSQQKRVRTKNYYKIGEFANIAGVCSQTSQTICNYMFANKLKYEVIY